MQLLPIEAGRSEPASCLDITVSNAGETDDAISEAVRKLIPGALNAGHGILVTRIDFTNYLVAISEEVSCGTVRERSFLDKPEGSRRLS